MEQNSPTLYYNKALELAGTCTVNDDMNAYFLHVRTLAVRMLEEQERLGSFLDKYQRALNGGKKNGNDGYHNFEAIITKVYLDPSKANRAFIEYQEQNDGQWVPAKRPLRTSPTSDPEANALYQQLTGLIGHKARLFKWPEPVQGNVTVKTEFGEQKVNNVAVLFHVVDLGVADGHNQGAAPQQGQGPANQPNTQQNAPQVNNQQPPAFPNVQEAKNALYNGLKNTVPNAPASALKEAAAAGWGAIGNPTTSPTAAGMDQAMNAAMAHLNQLAQNANAQV